MAKEPRMTSAERREADAAAREEANRTAGADADVEASANTSDDLNPDPLPSGPGPAGSRDVTGTGITTEGGTRTARYPRPTSAAAREKELQQIDRQVNEGSISEEEGEARRQALEGGATVQRAGEASEANPNGGVRITNRQGENVRVQVFAENSKPASIDVGVGDTTSVDVPPGTRIVIENVS